jgi:hypothetical protein
MDWKELGECEPYHEWGAWMKHNCPDTCGYCPGKLKVFQSSKFKVQSLKFKVEDQKHNFPHMFIADRDGGWAKVNSCVGGKTLMVCNNPAPMGAGAYCSGSNIADC